MRIELRWGVRAALAVLFLLIIPLASWAEAIKVLTVGNSFAQDATVLLPGLAKAADRDLLVMRVNLGGCSLERHATIARAADEGDIEKARSYKRAFYYTSPELRPRLEQGASKMISLQEALQLEKWDYVTIQQASPLSFKVESYEPHAGYLIDLIQKLAPSAQILIHETWAYREDHSFFKKGDFSQQKMYDGLKQAYEKLSQEYGFSVVPVGTAFQAARVQERWRFQPKDFDYAKMKPGEVPEPMGGLNTGWLWRNVPEEGEKLVLDAIHANTAGRYLGACVFYEQLFGQSVVGNTFKPASLSEEEARDLQAIAHEAVKTRQQRR